MESPHVDKATAIANYQPVPSAHTSTRTTTAQTASGVYRGSLIAETPDSAATDFRTIRSRTSQRTLRRSLRVGTNISLSYSNSKPIIVSSRNLRISRSKDLRSGTAASPLCTSMTQSFASRSKASSCCVSLAAAMRVAVISRCGFGWVNSVRQSRVNWIAQRFRAKSDDRSQMIVQMKKRAKSCLLAKCPTVF